MCHILIKVRQRLLLIGWFQFKIFAFPLLLHRKVGGLNVLTNNFHFHIFIVKVVFLRKYFIFKINCNIGEVRDMMEKHQFDEYQMHETLNEANDNFMMKRSQDSGLSTVNEEDDDLQTNPSGGGQVIPQVRITFGSISSQGSNNESMTSDDVEFQKREEERIKEMYKVLNIERRKSVAKSKTDGLDITRDYVRRASMAQGLAADKSRPGSRANSRRGSFVPSSNGGGLNPNDIGRGSGRRGSIMPSGQRRPSTIFMPPKTYRDRQPSVF